MEHLLVKGGVRLKGEVTVSGAKNAALPAMAASLLAAGTMRLDGVPNLVDVRTMGRLLESMGVKYRFSDGSAELDASKVRNHVAPYEQVKTMRASVLVLGPLVARFGRARVSLPGGCAIGARPINLHIAGLHEMGASVALEEGYVVARAKRLHGARICLDMPTVTGTENLMMAASLARGTTVIENAAREPEVTDLAQLLNAMGAKINGAGEGIITIEGVEELRPVRHTVIPDRIESGTFMAAAAVTKGDVTLVGADTRHLDAVVLKFKESGVEFKDADRGLRVTSSGRLSASDLKTMPYPGFPTDMQAQFMAMMSVAMGTSIIQERIFENRFMHVAELRRMGADISEEAGVATVRGGRALRGAEVMATDLRASASLVVAALAAHGTTTIHRLYHLDRGYDRIEEKLRRLGASIKRVKGRT
jgi:UDP-N-acetylglucosamine 1-carboxyvinyltransferase